MLRLLFVHLSKFEVQFMFAPESSTSCLGFGISGHRKEGTTQDKEHMAWVLVLFQGQRQQPHMTTAVHFLKEQNVNKMLHRVRETSMSGPVRKCQRNVKWYLRDAPGGLKMDPSENDKQMLNSCFGVSKVGPTESFEKCRNDILEISKMEDSQLPRKCKSISICTY